jgi:hypothetical protein
MCPCCTVCQTVHSRQCVHSLPGAAVPAACANHYCSCSTKMMTIASTTSSTTTGSSSTSTPVLLLKVSQQPRPVRHTHSLLSAHSPRIPDATHARAATFTSTEYYRTSTVLVLYSYCSCLLGWYLVPVVPVLVLAGTYYVLVLYYTGWLVPLVRSCHD